MVPQSIPLTIVAPQTRRLWSLHKACPRKITERSLILWRLAVNLHFPKMFKSHWKHKGKTAENCWLLSDCSLKTPPCIKEENIVHCKLMDLTNPGMSFGVRQFHVSQTSAQKPRKKMTPVQKKTQTTNTYSVAARRAVQARCIDVFNCCSEARAGSCEVLARNFHWYPLVLPELSAGFHFDSRGDTRETWGIQPGRSRELAHKVPTLQTEIIFFSSLSIKSVMWGLFFFLSCNCISCYKQTSGWSDSTR